MEKKNVKEIAARSPRRSISFRDIANYQAIYRVSSGSPCIPTRPTGGPINGAKKGLKLIVNQVHSATREASKANVFEKRLYPDAVGPEEKVWPFGTPHKSSRERKEAAGLVI